jgi:hypothetical protein
VKKNAAFDVKMNVNVVMSANVEDVMIVNVVPTVETNAFVKTVGRGQNPAEITVNA